ncbi:MAG: hypothetical protein P8J20_20135 [Novosphingobium sp.]|nr:hypothetical protein [Novosphingobium sp.]
MGTSVREIVEAILEFEGDPAIWDVKLRGMPFWHFLRYELSGLMLGAIGLQGKRQGGWRSRPLSDWLPPSPSRLGATLRNGPLADLKPSELLVLNHPRHVFSAAHRGWICPYSEPLLDAVDYSRQVLETPFAGQHYHPNATRNAHYLEWHSRPRLLRGYLNAKTARRAENLAAIAVDWSQNLATASGMRSPDADKVARLAKGAARRALAYYETHNRLLDQVQPRLVLQVVHYTPRNLVMSHLARERSVPVAELQHGWIGETHLAYAMRHRPLPTTLPSHVLLFGEAWSKFADFPWPDDCAPVIGAAWFNRNRQAAIAGEGKKPGRRVVLFVSQASIAEQLSRFAADFASHDTGGQYSIIYKLHGGEPSDWRRAYPWLANERIRVVGADRSIYDLFCKSDAQLGVYSTALFEGMGFGLATYIAPIAGHEAMKRAIDIDLARPVSSAEDLVRQLEQNIGWQPGEAGLPELWAEDPERRFQAFLDQHCQADGHRTATNS